MPSPIVQSSLEVACAGDSILITASCHEGDHTTVTVSNGKDGAEAMTESFDIELNEGVGAVTWTVPDSGYESGIIIRTSNVWNPSTGVGSKQ